MSIEKGDATKYVHTGNGELCYELNKALTVPETFPIYLSSAYIFDSIDPIDKICDEGAPGYAYFRLGNPNADATSQILAAAVNKIGVGPEDIVFCGRQAIDGDTAQVGPQIAEKLHLPQVTYVTDIQKDGNSLTVKRQLEDGYMELKVNTPCLLTCIKELNTPRYMSVSGIFECYDKPLEVFDYNALKDDPLIETDTIGLKGSPTNVYKSFAPPVKGAGMKVEDAAQLVGILNDKHLI